MNKCKWQAHSWEFTGGHGTDVYEHPQKCSRCGDTRTHIKGVTTDAHGRLTYVVLLMVVLAVATGLWFLYHPAG